MIYKIFHAISKNVTQQMAHTSSGGTQAFDKPANISLSTEIKNYLLKVRNTENANTLSLLKLGWPSVGWPLDRSGSINFASDPKSVGLSDRIGTIGENCIRRCETDGLPTDFRSDAATLVETHKTKNENAENTRHYEK